MGMRKSHDESVYHKPLFHKLSKNRYFNDKTSNVKCHAGNSGNVNLHFFHCKLYNDLFFFNFQKLYFTMKLYQMDIQLFTYIETYC